MYTWLVPHLYKINGMWNKWMNEWMNERCWLNLPYIAFSNTLEKTVDNEIGLYFVILVLSPALKVVSLLQFKMVKKNTCIIFHVVFILLLDFVLLLSYSRHIAKSNNKINGASFEVLTIVDEDANILRRNILSIGKFQSSMRHPSLVSGNPRSSACPHTHIQKHYAALKCQ